MYSEHIKEVYIEEMTSEVALEGCGKYQQAEQRGGYFSYRNETEKSSI